MYRKVDLIDFRFKNSYSLEETITSIRNNLIYDRPDNAGIFIDKDFPIALGHRRLSILSLSPFGYQPMEFENLVTAYNGEVYNFEEIKNCLTQTLKTYTPDDILIKVDRVTMSVALEGREPFLDHRIVERTSQVPVEFRYKNGVSKYLLRKVLYKYIPKELVERPKQGFWAPIYELWRNKWV